MSAAAPYPSQPPNGVLPASGVIPNGKIASFNGGERAYSHIQDLRLLALTGFKRDGSVPQLLQDAETALGQSRSLLEFSRRPDLAYVEYMRAFEIVTEVIPHHRGWADLQMDHGGGTLPKFQMLQKRILAQADQFASIKEIIVNNNLRSGVQPKSSTNDVHDSDLLFHGRNGSTSSVDSAVPKKKPTPSPKPANLHGRAVSHAPMGPSPSDPLRDRLAKLRASNPAVDTDRPDSRGSNHSSTYGSPTTTSMPNSSDYSGRASTDTISTNFSRMSVGSGRPLGPRGMPNGAAVPSLAGTLPLNTAFAASMPQEPKATYSPARNMQANGNIDLPRQTPRSLVSTNSRKSSLGPSSSASAHAPNGIYSTSDGGYFPPVPHPSLNGSRPGQARRTSTNAPETSIGAQRLYDYLERFNILLIDFRARQQFDEGHVYHRNIMCIDPIHITQGMSAEQLLERMVISPEAEQDMFANRDKFDLVIYYDAGTQSESFLARPADDSQLRLKYLYEALHDFNDDRPLQRPPILLVGGIEAWADLVGNQALATSETAARVKQGRPIQRRPLGGAPLRQPKRRLREYNPLDEDEERKWRERARAESVVLPDPPINEEDEEALQDEGAEGEVETPYSAIDDFNQRFPDAGQLDKYAFASLQPKRTAPEPPPKVPIANYPAPPPASSYPSVPTRPMPAAPRTSYTGVSDRAGSQNVPIARSMTTVPYIPAKYLSSSFKLPQTGLENFGVTCYMNATLQAFSATKALSIYFIEEAFRKHLQRDNWKGTNGLMPELYANLVRSLWKNDCTYIRPSTFRKFCGRQNSQWMNDRQEQDAKEFFDFLVDCLHEDLNIKWAKSPLRELTRQEEAKRERMPRSVVAMMEWQRYTHRNQSFPLTLFGGQYSSMLKFDGCGHTSTTHEAFFALSVEIPQNIRGRRITLDDCLHSFCSAERLDPSERAKCDQCDERKDSIKQLTLTRAPQFLVIHFKRFKTVRGGTRKLDDPIQFPLDNLDLGPYMLPSPSPQEAEMIARSFDPAFVHPEPSMTPPYTYSAYAVIRHLGNTIEAGHYKALVRDLGRSTWKCFNDRVVQEVDGRDLCNGQAYIVFFQRNNGSSTAPIGPGGVGKI